MGSASRLSGRTVFLLEDEPLVSLELVDALAQAGANIIVARTLIDGLRVAEHPNISAAILDVKLSDGDCSAVCHRLGEREIPYVVYSGYSAFPRDCSAGAVVSKPATAETLIAKVSELLAAG